MEEPKYETLPLEDRVRILEDVVHHLIGQRFDVKDGLQQLARSQIHSVRVATALSGAYTEHDYPHSSLDENFYMSWLDSETEPEIQDFNDSVRPRRDYERKLKEIKERLKE